LWNRLFFACLAVDAQAGVWERSEPIGMNRLSADLEIFTRKALGDLTGHGNAIKH